MNPAVGGNPVRDTMKTASATASTGARRENPVRPLRSGDTPADSAVANTAKAPYVINA